VERVEAVLQKVGLPVLYRGIEPGAVRRAMSADKKKAGGKLKFALPEAIGRVRVGCEVEEEVIGRVLEEVRE
jgi:3-dehydroquinate synthase